MFQIGMATLQMLNSHVWLAATMLDSEDLDSHFID